MATSDYLDPVQQLYIAYFGRPADPTGLRYWANQVSATGGNMAVAIAGFSASTESTNLFGGLPTAQKISAIYLNLFNRLPESAGLSYWISQIDSGAVTQAQAAWQIMNQAGAGDSTSVANKLAMANAFTAQVDTAAEIAGYSGAQPAAFGRAYLAGVDATPASVSNASAALNSSVADATGVRPTAPTSPSTLDPVFIFTTGVDNFTGGPGNDTFVGKIDTTTLANTTLSALDSIDGGKGTDTLSITVTGTASPVLPALKISNVEKLLIRDQNTSGSASAYNLFGTSIIDVTSDVSTAPSGLDIGSIAAGGTLSLLGDNSTQVANVNFRMVTDAAAINLVFDGGLKDTGLVAGQTTVTNISGRATTAAITSSGAANTLGVITLAGSAANTLTKATINANTDLTATLLASDYASNATLTVNGAGKVDLGSAVGFDGSVIDASTNTGGLTAALSANTKTFTGGKGNDTAVGTVTVFGDATTTVANTAVIDGGAGIDTFSATLLSSTNGAAFKNFEVLDLTGSGTVNGGVVDASKLNNSTLTGVVVNGNPGGALQVNHLTETPDGFNVTLILASAGANLKLQFDNVSGSSDVLNLTHTSAANGVSFSTLNIEGIETIKVNAAAVAGTNNGLIIVDNAAKLIEITGNRLYSLIVTAQSGSGASQLTKVDGSQATGSMSIKVEAATTTGGQSALTLLGGSSADTFIVETSAQANSTGVTVTTNGGADSVNVFNASLRDVSALSKLQFTTITDFTAGDKVNLPASVNFQTAAVNVSGATDLLTALQLAAAGTSANYATWFQLAGDSYLVLNRVANSGLTADDVVVKMAGLTDLSELQGSGSSMLTL